MAFYLLLQRIDERLAAMGLSERKACLNAGIGVNTIRHIRNRGHEPSGTNLVALADALKVPSDYFLDAAFVHQERGHRRHSVDRVFVRGAVQAGVFKPAMEWDADDWYSVTVPEDDRYPGLRRYGLEISGPSMNRLYAEETVVILVSFGDLGRTPQPKEKVLVLVRSDVSDDFEATVKEYDRDDEGRHILWPRSSDPQFQTPIILSDQDLPPVPDETWDILEWPDQEMLAGGEVGKVLITGLVIGSYRRE